MSSADFPQIEEILPSQAWGMLKDDPRAVLVDVRTRAEWSYVGLPDLAELGNLLVLAEWARLPDMSVNPGFEDELLAQLGDMTPSALLFLCRSGVRSLYAARAVATRLNETGTGLRCLNVATGFEGDLDDVRHRGNRNGWKVARLPWRQT